MGLIYKFPKLYQYMIDHCYTYIPGTSIPDDLQTSLPFQQLAPGAIILDIACGTGTLTLWLAQQRPDVHVIGLDLSNEILIQAKTKADALGLKNVSFVNKSAVAVTGDDLLSEIATPKNSKTPLGMIICSYGFSAMDNYEAVFRHTLSLLAPKGIYVVMDLYYPKRTLATLFATYLIDELLFSANQFRKPFLVMQDELADFAMQEKPVTDYGFVPGIHYVAKGVKR